MDNIRDYRGHKWVGGVGPRKPKLIWIGEALGENEEKEGIPFVPSAYSGSLLDQMIRKLGMTREECYITNVVKVRPPSNKIEKLIDIGMTVEEFIPYLQEELNGIDCKYAIPLGGTALKVMTGKEGILKWRGSPLYSTLCPQILTVPTVHPRFVADVWSMLGTMAEDGKKIMRYVREGYHPVTFNTLTRPLLNEVEGTIHYILHHCDRFVFDIETYRSGQISCIGIGYYIGSTRHSICIPLKYGLRNYWEYSDELYIWKLLQNLWNSDLLKIGQFINFDLTKLLPFLGEPKPPWFDLNVAHHTLDPELPHDLAFMTSIYTDIPYYKDDTKQDGESWTDKTPSELLWEYNGKDCEGPLIIYDKLVQELNGERLMPFFTGFAMPKMRALWRVQNRGILVDQQMRESLLYQKLKEVGGDKAIAEYEAIKKGDNSKETKIILDSMKYGGLQGELEELVGHEINVSSPKQFAKLLYEELKLPKQYDRKTKRLTTGEKALEYLDARYPNPIFEKALDIRGLKKEIGTYLMFRLSSDGRCRTTYNSTGTNTAGRASSSKHVDGTGLDMQNVPKNEESPENDMRRMFVAGPGKTFVEYDQWQAESIIVANIGHVRSFLAKMAKGEKVHKMVGSWIYNKPEEELTKKEYKQGKQTVHGKSYKMGPNTFSIFCKIPVAEAKRISAKFDERAPEIAEWHRTVEIEVKSNKKLITPYGRVRYFRGRMDDDTFRKAIAHVPQSTVGDNNHMALMRIEYQYLPWCLPVQDGFDAVVCEVEESRLDEAKKVIEEAYDKELFYRGDIFKIPVEGLVSKRWGGSN